MFIIVITRGLDKLMHALEEDYLLDKLFMDAGIVSRKTKANIGWSFPSLDWIKVNMDGSIKLSCFARCGGVSRDSAGCWLTGFNRYIGVPSVVMAELWGLFSGMKLAQEHGWRRIPFELDSKVAVGLVTEGCQDAYPCSTYVVITAVAGDADVILQIVVAAAVIFFKVAQNTQ